MSPDADSTVLVEALALPPSPSLAAYAVTVINSEDLARAASSRLDDALRAVPGFGLFRRSSSTAAHPTAQGISLRAIGPSGAGRTLVLVDGMPANDPFGGWIYWSALAPAAIERVDIIRGGGAGPYGNAALAGTIRITSRLPQGNGGYADLSVGSKSTFAGSGGAYASSGALTIDIGGQIFDSAGYDLIERDQQGPIDRPGASTLKRGQLGMTWHGDGLTLRLQAAAFDEQRVNGSPGARNSTRSREASLRIVRDGDTDMEATLWGIDRHFRSSFTSVNADRSAETPALDQFSTPVKAAGGNLLLRRAVMGGTLEWGGDARLIDGDTNEFFQYLAGDFQRLRKAGGRQFLGGVFADYSHDLGPVTLLTGGLRLDYLRDSQGQRSESQRATGAILLDNHYADHERLAVNGRLGLVQTLSPALKSHLSLYSGFRNPTLNELYRPFRVRNDITEANPALTPERLYGADLGLDWTHANGARASLTGFWTMLQDGVTTLLITSTPGSYPEFGVVLPAGGNLSQRRNLDRLRTMGLEADVSLPLGPGLTLDARYLLSLGKITRASTAPELVGKRPPQSARHQGGLGLDWQSTDRLRLNADLRAESAQYDDILNSRRLPGYATLDLAASLAIGPGVELYGTVQNLFDHSIISGESADGLRSLGTPRLLRTGLRARF
nr:TonB-dependent receptor [Govania unica]